MSDRPDLWKTTDDDVRAILLADGTDVQIAGRFGVSARLVGHYRSRRSKRAIRIAHELGLIDTLPPRTGWGPRLVAEQAR